jgi:CBS domain containing-hemolysin-like protein
MMEGSFTGLILFVAIALGVSFVCSILEAVLLSVSASHVEVLAQKGERVGHLMQKHKSDIERPISAILTLNTIAHTVGAAGAGAEAAAIFGSQFIGVISAILTFLILVFSEIIPKTLGAVYWKQLTPFTAYSLQLMMIVLFPVVWVFKQITVKMKPEHGQPTVSRLDLEAMAFISTKEGALMEQENRIFHNLLQLKDIQVSTIMTPRIVVTALQQDLTVGQVLEKLSKIPFSRIPIYTDDLDDITDYVLRYQIYEYAAHGRLDVPLKDFSRKIHAVPETKPVAKVMEDFIERKEHILLLIDEYGGTAGIITQEDVMESLLGIEITDETDLVADLRQLARERYERTMTEQVARNLQTQQPQMIQFSLPTPAERERALRLSTKNRYGRIGFIRGRSDIF